MYMAGRDGNVKSKCDVWFVLVKGFVHGSRRDFIASPNSNAVQPQVRGLYDGNLCCLSALRRSCVMLTKHVYLFPSLRMISGVIVHPLCTSMHITIRLKLSHANSIFHLYMTHTFWCNTQIHSNYFNQK